VTLSTTGRRRSQRWLTRKLKITIESLNARYRRVVRARGHFPTEQTALMCLHLVTRSLDPTGNGRARWAMRWKPALNAFAITFEGRIVPSTTK
jgi:transposase-like protein